MNNNHSTQKKLKNLGSAMENPNVRKPKERERFYYLQEIYISINNTISSQEKFTYNTQNYPHNILPWKKFQIHTTIGPAQKLGP
jgi:hypothetical protein